MRRRAGFTLVEMLVTLVVVGVAAGVTALAFGAPPGASSEPPTLAERIREARRAAVLEGVPVRLRADSLAPEPVLLLPDGRLVGAEGLDPLTGRRRP